MTLRAPVGPSTMPWKRTTSEARADDPFQRRVLALWDTGKDTKDIAIETQEDEAVVAVALWVARNKRRMVTW